MPSNAKNKKVFTDEVLCWMAFVMPQACEINHDLREMSQSELKTILRIKRVNETERIVYELQIHSDNPNAKVKLIELSSDMRGLPILTNEARKAIMKRYVEP